MPILKPDETYSRTFRKATSGLWQADQPFDPVAVSRDLFAAHVVSDDYSDFQDRYYYDPAGFVTNCIHFNKGYSPAPYQLQALRDLVTHKRLCIRAPHSAGKTSTAAWAVLWFALTRDGRADWKVPMTASVWRQLTKFLMPEVHKWARSLRWEIIGRDQFSKNELQQQGIKLGTGEAFAVASNNPALIEGAHADSLMYVFDEAKTIRGETFDAAEGAFATAGDDTAAEAFGFALSTPGEPAGRFYDIQSRKPGYTDWHAVAITKDQAVAAGRMSAAWVAARLKQWGEKNPVFVTRVLGEFSSNSELSMIPLSWIEAANERWHEWNEEGLFGRPIRLGVDVARFGRDLTYLAMFKDSRGGSVDRLPFGISSLTDYAKIDTMAVAGKVREVLAHPDNRGLTASIDTIGIGAGVYDRLREMGYPVFGYNASHKSTRRDRTRVFSFSNVRAESFYNLRELLDPQYGLTFCLPPHDDLTGDLAVLQHTTDSDGKIRVEAKEKIKERIGRSTDAGDAAAIAMYVPPQRRKYVR